MQCPQCKADSKVIDSRPCLESRSIRRRRECKACRHRWTTYELAEAAVLPATADAAELERFRNVAHLLPLAEEMVKTIQTAHSIRGDGN